MDGHGPVPHDGDVGAERSSRRVRLVVAVTVFASSFAGAVALPRPASASDPIFVSWTDVLPSLTDQYDPTSANDCVSGRYTCVDKTIREMTRRFDPLADRCDHNAIFALSYLRTTQVYKEAAAETGFFADP